MGFIKGQDKPPGSGRQKGTPNKKTVIKVSDYLGEAGVNPTEEILKIINETAPVLNAEGVKIADQYILKSAERAKLWLELLSFCHAKPKELTLKSAEDGFDPHEFDNIPTEALQSVLNPKSSGTA